MHASQQKTKICGLYYEYMHFSLSDIYEVIQFIFEYGMI